MTSSADRTVANPDRRQRSGVTHEQLLPLTPSGGVHLTARPRRPDAADGNQVVADVHTTWDLERFNVARRPLVIGSARLAPPAPLPPGQVISLPIKLPGTDYRIPPELIFLTDAIQQCADAEAAINPCVDEYHCYLAYEFSRTSPVRHQRGLGPHSDAVQGPRIVPKTYIDHMYAGVTCDPTRFYTHPFDLSGYDENVDYLSAVFAALADPARSVTHMPGDIVLFDAYSVHEGILAAVESDRGFFRLSYATRRYDRVGNSHNPMFDYDWAMVPRPIPSLRGIPAA